MNFLKKIGKGMCWLVFIASAALMAFALLTHATKYHPFAGVLAAGAVTGYLCLRKRGGVDEDDDAVIRLYDRLILYPVAAEVEPAGGGREKYARDLSYQGFLPIGLYRVHKLRFGDMTATGYLIEGFVNGMEKAYAAVHYPEGGEAWLEIIAPATGGRGITCANDDRDDSVFAKVRPGHVVAAARGGRPADLMELLRENRAANSLDPEEVTSAGFAAFYMREDAAHRAWLVNGMEEMRDLDLELRNRAIDAGLATPDTVEDLVIVHDRLAMWQVNFILLLRGLRWMTDADRHADTWKYMSPRHVFAYIAEHPQKLRSRLKPLATLDAPLAADVYQVARK